MFNCLLSVILLCSINFVSRLTDSCDALACGVILYAVVTMLFRIMLQIWRTTSGDCATGGEGAPTYSCSLSDRLGSFEYFFLCINQERQSQSEQAQHSKDSKRARKISESDGGFGIDQNASFLSSGLALDDLLKLKQSQRDLSERSRSPGMQGF